MTRIDTKRRGQIQQAPENFLTQDAIADLNKNGLAVTLAPLIFGGGRLPLYC